MIAWIAWIDWIVGGIAVLALPLLISYVRTHEPDPKIWENDYAPNAPAIPLDDVDTATDPSSSPAEVPDCDESSRAAAARPWNTAA